jgi:hypothetical protein
LCAKLHWGALSVCSFVVKLFIPKAPLFYTF